MAAFFVGFFGQFFKGLLLVVNDWLYDIVQGFLWKLVLAWVAFKFYDAYSFLNKFLNVVFLIETIMTWLYVKKVVIENGIIFGVLKTKLHILFGFLLVFLYLEVLIKLLQNVNLLRDTFFRIAFRYIVVSWLALCCCFVIGWFFLRFLWRLFCLDCALTILLRSLDNRGLCCFCIVWLIVLRHSRLFLLKIGLIILS